MTNGQRFYTVEDRKAAFFAYCKSHAHDKCLQGEHCCSGCAFEWLEKEIEVLKPCPCCGESSVHVVRYEQGEDKRFYVACPSLTCLYQGPKRLTPDDAIRDHNRLMQGVEMLSCKVTTICFPKEWQRVHE